MRLLSTNTQTAVRGKEHYVNGQLHTPEFVRSGWPQHDDDGQPACREIAIARNPSAIEPGELFEEQSIIRHRENRLGARLACSD